MHVGLIGGIGPAATTVYHAGLAEAAAAAGRGLDLTIVHADMPTLLANLMAGRAEAQVAIHLRLTERLRAAGAGCVAIASVAGHFCARAFAPLSPLPVVDLTEALAAHLRARGLSRVGILGTGPVMRSGMYGALAPAEVIAPEGAELERVHAAYVDLAATGRPAPGHRAAFVGVGRAMAERGAEAVLLGGTDLNAVFDAAPPPFPVVDCARLHVEALARRI